MAERCSTESEEGVVAEIVVMPKLGLTMKEGHLVQWLADEGERVRAGQPIVEVETDKVTNQVESPADGILLRRIDPEVDVPVGEPIGVVGEPGEDTADIRLFGES